MRDDVETVVQVLAEALGRNFLGEVLVGGRDDTHIDLHGGDPPEALKRAILQHPQELRLHLKGHIANFVEEQGPPIGQLKMSRVCVAAPR